VQFHNRLSPQLSINRKKGREKKNLMGRPRTRTTGVGSEERKGAASPAYEQTTLSGDANKENNDSISRGGKHKETKRGKNPCSKGGWRVSGKLWREEYKLSREEQRNTANQGRRGENITLLLEGSKDMKGRTLAKWEKV